MDLINEENLTPVNVDHLLLEGNEIRLQFLPREPSPDQGSTDEAPLESTQNSDEEGVKETDEQASCGETSNFYAKSNISGEESKTDREGALPESQSPSDLCVVELSSSNENAQENKASEMVVESPNIPQEEISVLAIMPPPPKRVKFMDNHKKIPCVNESLGCSETFLSNMARNQHQPKCKFNILMYCKDPKCVSAGLGPFESLIKLVEHSRKEHGCVKVRQGGESLNRAQIILNYEIFNPQERDFASKFLVDYEDLIDGEKFRFVFIAFVEPNQDCVSIIPVLVGEDRRVSHYVRLNVGLTNEKGNAICAMQPLPHSSHELDNGKKVICMAFGPAQSLFDAIKNNEIITFSKDDFIVRDDKQVETFAKVELAFTVHPYRCTIQSLNDVISSAPRYLLTTDELDVGIDAQKMMKLGGKTGAGVPLAIAGVIIPHIRAKHNFMIQSPDLDQTLRTIMPTILENRGEFSISARRATGLILFPALFMLDETGSSVKKMADSIGLVCSIVKNDDDNSIDDLILDGCDVLITTLLTFHKLRKKKSDDLNHVLISNLKIVVVPNADILLQEQYAQASRKCFSGLHKMGKVNLVRISIAPLCGADLQNCLKLNMYGRDEVLQMCLGPKQSVMVDALPIFSIHAADCRKKIEMVVKILRIHEQKKRWLVIGNKGDSNYKENFNSLEVKLQDNFPGWRKSFIRRDEEDYTDPSFFAPFQKQSRTVLLTSYFCLHYDVMKRCEGIILFGLPDSESDIVRMVPLLNSLDKPVYCLRDRKHPGSVNFQLF